MKLILALGNPGTRYRDTRHNVGWWLANHLAARWLFPPFRAGDAQASTEGEVGEEAVRIVKPLTYMNRSGQSLGPYVSLPDFRPERDLLVLVDDVALMPGHFRMRGGGSSGGHNGLASVEAFLGTREYGRLRIGVGSPTDHELDLAAWVLSAPSPEEEEAVLESFGAMGDAATCWIAEGMDSAMNRYNRPKPGAPGA